MKYFTPERYLKLGNLNDEGAFLAAHEEWEQAIEDYKKHWQRIGPELPGGLRRLVDSVYLHDARVLDMWQGRVSRFTITLQPESDPARLVVLAYSLAEPPHIEEGVLPPENRSAPAAWLYDELDVQRKAGRPAAFTHDILLSNGWEVHLRFRGVAVTRPVAFLPAVPENHGIPASVSRSA